MQSRRISSVSVGVLATYWVPGVGAPELRTALTHPLCCDTVLCQGFNKQKVLTRKWTFIISTQFIPTRCLNRDYIKKALHSCLTMNSYR